MEALISGQLTEVYLLQHIGSFLDGISLSTGRVACRQLCESFSNETLWKDLVDKFGMKTSNRTRTRNIKLFRQIYIDNSCIECREGGILVINLSHPISLCGRCTNSIRAHDTQSKRLAARLLPRVAKKRGDFFLRQVLDKIPTTKDLKKSKKLKDASNVDSVLQNDHLITKIKR